MVRIVDVVGLIDDMAIHAGMRWKAIAAMALAIFAAGCASPQRVEYVMQQPAASPTEAQPPPPRTITFPNGTVFGGASSDQASTLAQIVVDANNNNMKDFAELQATENKNLQVSNESLQVASKNLQTAQQALTILERLSDHQGTGEITLFFPTGKASIPQNGLQYGRLVRFLDYLSRESRGRTVLLVVIGSSSPTGPAAVNERLSQERSLAPSPVIDQYLVNVPHQYYKVYGLGDFYAGKDIPRQDDQRYQSVRIIAVYQTNQIPLQPQ